MIEKTDTPCECIQFIQGNWVVDSCDCGNTGDTIQAASWCSSMNSRSKLRKNYRNIWCILRSLDRHEIDCPGLDWPAFRDHPHEFFLRCDDPTSDSIWKAVEKRL